jgi:hypothetical protein
VLRRALEVPLPVRLPVVRSHGLTIH